MIDDSLAFAGTYDWEARQDGLWHKRQPLHERMFLRLERGSQDDEFLMETLSRRFHCREHDADCAT